MTPDDLKARTRKFAVNVTGFATTIPKDPINDEIASQLTDAATSTAAYYRAVCRARRRARGGTGLSPQNEQSTIDNQQLINNLKSKITNGRHLELPDAASASRLRP